MWNIMCIINTPQYNCIVIRLLVVLKFIFELNKMDDVKCKICFKYL